MTFVFGDVELDPDGLEVRSNGERLALGPQAFAVGQRRLLLRFQLVRAGSLDLLLVPAPAGLVEERSDPRRAEQLHGPG